MPCPQPIVGSASRIASPVRGTRTIDQRFDAAPLLAFSTSARIHPIRVARGSSGRSSTHGDRQASMPVTIPVSPRATRALVEHSAPSPGRGPPETPGRRLRGQVEGTPACCVRCLSRGAPADCRAKQRDRGIPTLYLDDESLVVLVIQVDHDRTLGIVNIVEDRAVQLVEGPRGDDAGNLRSGHADAMPPTPHCLECGALSGLSRRRAFVQRRSATTDQIASTMPNGHAPCRNP